MKFHISRKSGSFPFQICKAFGGSKKNAFLSSHFLLFPTWKKKMLKYKCDIFSHSCLVIGLCIYQPINHLSIYLSIHPSWPPTYFPVFLSVYPDGTQGHSCGREKSRLSYLGSSFAILICKILCKFFGLSGPWLRHLWNEGDSDGLSVPFQVLVRPREVGYISNFSEILRKIILLWKTLQNKW